MNEESKATQKCIQDLMEGRALLRRGYRRPGQSEYYYLTKNFDDSYNQIDVPDDFGRQWFGKTLPDNFQNDYKITKDMNEHPEKYYIWYTMSDNKVRSLHAERHGKIFRWDTPPQGGHPGEDYNCRCLAIPYKPQYDQKKFLNDLIKNIDETQGKIDLFNAEIATMEKWIKNIREEKIKIYKKIQKSSLEGLKNGIEGANENGGIVAEIAGKIKNNPYLDFYNLLAGRTSGMFATTLAEYNSQKRQLLQLSQDEKIIAGQIEKRKDAVSDMRKEMHKMKQYMELINAF